jgi:ATP-dependent DNA helicase PIF1
MYAEPAERVLSPEVWEIEFGGKTVAKRTQIPLRLAWALSIHKSQGMSIDRLKVSLSGVFEFGQAYVALSRATSVKGLILEGFKPELVKAHPEYDHSCVFLVNVSVVD